MPAFIFPLSISHRRKTTSVQFCPDLGRSITTPTHVRTSSGRQLRFSALSHSHSHSRSHPRRIFIAENPSSSSFKPFNPRSSSLLSSSPYDNNNNDNNNNNNNNNNNTFKFTYDDDDDNDDDDEHSSISSPSSPLLLLQSLAFPSLFFVTCHFLSRSSSSSLLPRRFFLSHAILGVNILMFIIQSVFAPGLLLALAKVNSAIAMGQFYRLITPIFVHASSTHLMVNSLSLNSTGPSVESWFGKTRFLFLYAFSGLCGNVLSYLCTPSPAVGASGAIFGLVGASAVMLARHNKLLGRRANKSLKSLAFIVLVNFGMGLTPGARIDNFGHLGGFLGGIVYSYVFGPSLKIRYYGNGRRPTVYDEPLFVQVRKDLTTRLRQLSRLLQQK